ncbi:MAG: SPOR domain-containing protein [Terriglobia bacterium]
MEQRSGSRPGARGLTVKQLTFIFVAGVAVCAIFFTLGFLVGANERNVNANTPTVERISPRGDIPPPVNPPLSPTPSSGANTSTAGTADSSGQIQEQNLPPSGPAGPASAPDQSTSPPVASAPPARPAKNKLPAASARSSNPPPARAPASGVIVQIAALHSVKDAESLVSTLRSQGYPAFLVTPEQASADDGVYRVQVGPYPTRPDAAKVRDKLAKEGFNPFIKE